MWRLVFLEHHCKTLQELAQDEASHLPFIDTKSLLLVKDFC